MDCASTDDESAYEEQKSTFSSSSGQENVYYLGKEDEYVAVKILSK